MTSRISQIKKITNGLQIFFLIAEIVSYIKLIIDIIKFILYAISGFADTSLKSHSVNVSGVIGKTNNLGVVLTTSILTWIFIVLIFHFARKVFKQISESTTPFLPESVKNLRMLACLILLFGIVPQLVYGVLALIFGGTFQGGAAHLLFAIILYGISLIFDYGYQLQVEADETL